MLILTNLRIFVASAALACAAAAIAQAPAGTGGKDDGGTPGKPASSQGAGFSALFSINHGKLVPNAAVTYDFHELRLAKTGTQKGVKGSDTPGDSKRAMKNFFAKHSRYTEDNPKMLADGSVNATYTGGFYTIKPTADNRNFRPFNAPGTSNSSFDLNGDWVDASGFVLDESGQRVVHNILERTVRGVNAQGNPTEITQAVIKNQTFFTLLAGAGTQEQDKVNAGFGAGLRFSFNGGNSSFFVGGWVDQLDISKTRLAIGFNILK